jgi:hypothetical protein
MSLPDTECEQSKVSDTYIHKSIKLLLLLPFFFVGAVNACTIFTAVKGKTVLMAGNEDETTNNSYLVVDPTGKYGVVFFATPMDGLPLIMQMGINEEGLSYDINAIPQEALTHVPGTIQQKEWALVALMRETASVNELLDRFFSYDWGASIAYQIHVADRFGDAVVIHPGHYGKLTYTRINKSKGYIVSANFNARDERFYKYIPGRHRTAERELTALSGAQGLTTEFMTSMLEKTYQKAGWIDPTRSIFSVVFNLTTLDIVFYYESNFKNPYTLNVRAELAKTRDKKIIPLPEVMSSLNNK